MALLRRGVIGDVSGAIGGIEVAQKPGTFVVKKRKTTRPAKTRESERADAQFVEHVRGWRELTDAQRLAWDTAARDIVVVDRMGGKRVRSGYQYYLTMPYDMRFISAGLNYTEPPLKVVEWTADVDVITLNDEQIELDTFFDPQDTFFGGYLYAARWQKTARGSDKNWFKVGSCTGQHSAGFNFFLGGGLFVQLVPGETVKLKFQMWRNGYKPVWVDLGMNTVSEAP